MRRQFPRRFKYGHSLEGDVDYSEGFVRTPDQIQRQAKLTRSFAGSPENSHLGAATVNAVNPNFERFDHASDVFADQPDVWDFAQRGL